MDGHKYCQMCLQVMRIEMDGYKHCQMCPQVMRWMNTNTVQSVGRSWMNTNTVKHMQVMRWLDTLSDVSAGPEMDGHIVIVKSVYSS